MAQLSRPVQIGALACAVLVLGVFFLLRGPGASSSGSSPSSPSVASSSGGSASHSSSSSSSSSSKGGSSSVYHGAAPGVEGLTRDIQRAHGAVAEVQHNAQAVQSKAAQGAGEEAGGTAAAASRPAAHSGVASTAGTHDATHAAGSHAATHAGPHAATRTAGSHRVAHPASSHATPAPSASATAASTLHHLTRAVHLHAVINLIEVLDPGLGVGAKVAHAEAAFIARMKSDLQPVSQATIAAELHHGKTVMLLFLNPGAYDDDATAIGTVEVAYKLRHDVVAHLALSSQVNSFGSVTRDIQIYQTPTLLIVNPKLQVTTLTGLTDEFALKQAIAEAKG